MALCGGEGGDDRVRGGDRHYAEGGDDRRLYIWKVLMQLQLNLGGS